MLVAVLAGLVAGAFWGLTFIAPLAISPFTAFDLTVARYLVYGTLSLPPVVALARGGGLDRRIVADSIWLAAGGFIGYFIIMAIAVKLSGVAVVALIVGTLPLVIAIIGNRGAERTPWRALLAPLVLIGAGLAVANLDAARDLMLESPESLPRFLLGVLLSWIAVALWAWYAFANARALARHPGVSSATWSALQGVGCLVWLPLVIVVALAAGDTRWRELGVNSASLSLVAWGIALGALASSVAMWLWSIASRRLPVALCGMLIVSETVFAVLYGAVYAERAPTGAEAAATLLLAFGVVLGVRAFAKPGEAIVA